MELLSIIQENKHIINDIINIAKTLKEEYDIQQNKEEYISNLIKYLIIVYKVFSYSIKYRAQIFITIIFLFGFICGFYYIK